MAEFQERIEDNPNTAYEQSDWPLGTIGLMLVGIFMMLVISPFVMIAAFPDTTSDVGRALTVEPPQPRLQTDPSADLAQFDATEDERLNSYYWINKGQGHRPHPDRTGDEAAYRGYFIARKEALSLLREER